MNYKSLTKAIDKESFQLHKEKNFFGYINRKFTGYIIIILKCIDYIIIIFNKIAAQNYYWISNVLVTSELFLIITIIKLFQ